MAAISAIKNETDTAKVGLSGDIDELALLFTTIGHALADKIAKEKKANVSEAQDAVVGCLQYSFKL